MPLIGPPIAEYEPILETKKVLVYKPPFGLTPYEDHRRVKLFDNCPTWKCCCNGKWTNGLTWHGRVEQCFYCKTPRPAEWKPFPWEYSI